jgi:hypothetical protein
MADNSIKSKIISQSFNLASLDGALSSKITWMGHLALFAHLDQWVGGRGYFYDQLALLSLVEVGDCQLLVQLGSDWQRMGDLMLA